MANPAIPTAALFSDSLRRTISKIDSVTTSGSASSKHQMLSPEQIPNIRNFARFGLGSDWINIHSVVRSGIERKYHEKPLTWKCHFRSDGASANTTLAKSAVR